MNPHDLSRLEAIVFNTPLCVTADRAELIASNLAERFGIEPMKPPTALSFEGSKGNDKPYSVVDSVATIAIHGELVNRGSWLSSVSGMVSYDGLAKALRAADEDYGVKSILLDIDSPGGEAAGMVETAVVIRSIEKPVVAFVNGVAASAAYGLAAAADEIVMTPSARVGSIGVVYLHLDRSAAIAKSGVKPTLIHAGKFKVDGNSLEPLEPESRARIQSAIDDVYGLFIESVGFHRPDLGAGGARKTEAAIFMGKKAVAAGLADRIGTLNDAISLVNARAPANAGPIFRSMDMTKEEHDAAVAAAVSQAVAAAKAEAGALSAKATDAAEAAAKTAAKESADRIAAIVNSPEAIGREPQAKVFAFETALPAEQAIKLLAAAAKPAAASTTRTGDLKAPAVGADGDEASADAAAAGAVPWASVVDRLNKEAKALNPAFRTP